MSRSRKSGFFERFLTVFIAAGFLLVVIVSFFSYQVVTAPPQPPGTPLGDLQQNPLIKAIGEPISQFAESLSNSFSVLSPQTSDESAIGLGATIGYTSSTGESIQYQTNRPFMMSGVGLMYAGIQMQPDRPGYRALKLYDEETGAEGEIWFQPFVNIAILNGTVERYSVKVDTKTMLRCDDGTLEILQYNSEERIGVGAPGKINFQKAATKGGQIYNKLRPALARGAVNCQLQLVADYTGEVKFAEDEEPIRKTLTNVVLGTFDLRKVTPVGDFEFRINSNATVRPLAEVMVGGTGGVGQIQTVTYTQTHIVVTTTGGQTVTQTKTAVITKTVEIATTRTVVAEVTRTVTEYVYAPRGAFAGASIIIPYDAFVFIRGERR
ncbi:MAG: hypothetical protein QW580_01975 [Nitrososphaerota archaeon]